MKAKVCVVGGAGFLGSHVVRELISQEYEVSIIDDLSGGKKKFIPEGVKLWNDTIEDPDAALLRYLEDCDYVMNYAASPFIPDCIDDPIQALLDNTVGALRLWQAAQKVGVKRILQVTSAEVYGNNKDGHLEPISSYAVSKAAIDQLINCRYAEANTPVIGLRQFNCIGERETHPYVVPEIINQVHQYNEEHPNATKIELYLGNNSTRDFMYAGDAARLGIEVLLKGELGECYELGSDWTPIQIYALAQTITFNMTGKEALIHVDESRVRPIELWSLQADNQRVYELTDLRPTISFGQAIEATIKYFRSNGNKWDFPILQKVA